MSGIKHTRYWLLILTITVVHDIHKEIGLSLEISKLNRCATHLLLLLCSTNSNGKVWVCIVCLIYIYLAKLMIIGCLWHFSLKKKASSFLLIQTWMKTTWEKKLGSLSPERVIKKEHTFNGDFSVSNPNSNSSWSRAVASLIFPLCAFNIFRMYN